MDTNIDTEIRIEYSEDGKTLIKCPKDFEGELIVPEGVEVIAYITGLTPSLKLGKPSAIIAIYDCPKLKSVKLPSTLREVDSWNFALCPNLAKIEVAEGNPVFDSRDNCHALIETATNTLIAGGYESTIPESIVELDDFAFWGCEKMEKLVLPQSLRKIGFKACYHLTALKELYIPANLTKLGWDNFHNCPNLEKIEVDEANPVYDSRKHCNAIINTERNYLILGCKNTVIPDHIKSIDDEAFSKCIGLTQITIPESVQRIGKEAFFGCESLEKVIIQSSRCTIDRSAFYDCTRLKQIQGLEHCETNSFYNYNCPFTQTFWDYYDKPEDVLLAIWKALQQAHLKDGKEDFQFVGGKQWIYVYHIILRHNKNEKGQVMIQDVKDFCRKLASLKKSGVVGTSQAALSGEENEVSNWEEEPYFWKLKPMDEIRDKNRFIKSEEIRQRNLQRGKKIAIFVEKIMTELKTM